MKIKNALVAFGLVSVALPLALVTTSPALAAGIPWDMGSDTCDTVTIKSLANNQYVAAEVDYAGYYSGMLRARTKSPGAWEKFSLCPGPGYKTLYSLGAKRYVSAEKNYTGADKGMLRARADSFKSFEQFAVDCEADTEHCTIRSIATGKYVSAELAYANDGYAMLRARADTVGSYERFLITI
ncbi:fascin domain-containing protein [Herbidospora daliensis]|uniref:fascin domain-containing protein n=1 Tax=Herbidospora daliensis TaxID=295585 RepID=UPI0007844515|nr:hypothetical protein [Herbidospora daliensis]